MVYDGQAHDFHQWEATRALQVVSIKERSSFQGTSTVSFVKPKCPSKYISSGNTGMLLVIGICVILVAVTSANTDSAIKANDNEFRPNKQKMDFDIIKIPVGFLATANAYNSKTNEWNEKWRTKMKKSFVTVDFHDGPKFQMQQLRSSGSPTDELFYSPLNNPKERRNPLFSPWGGKRNSIPYNLDPKIRRPARVPFNSWGGKRDNEHFDDKNRISKVKRTTSIDVKAIKKPFNSWGGKRSSSPMLLEYFVKYFPSNSENSQAKKSTGNNMSGHLEQWDGKKA